MIEIILGLFVLGCLLALMEYVTSKIPNFPPIIKTIIYVLVVVCAVLWLLGLFGLAPIDLPVPRFRHV